jgi:hypothetical protein
VVQNLADNAHIIHLIGKQLGSKQDKQGECGENVPPITGLICTLLLAKAMAKSIMTTDSMSNSNVACIALPLFV